MNIVAACYQKHTGCCAPVAGSPSSEDLAYRTWCENRVHEWRRFLPTGVHSDSFTVRIEGAELTFHDWLKQRVGL